MRNAPLPEDAGAAIARLRSMMLIRAFETALGKRPDHGFQLLGTGEEAVAVGLCAALDGHDQLLTGGRSIGPALARGLDPATVMAELLGRTGGMNGGRAGRGHLAAPDQGFFGAHAVVGGNISIAAGVALSMQMAGSAGIVAILFGDGACGSGALHETLNIAAVWKLPLLFVCNNNQLSVSTRREDSLAPQRLSDIAGAFGIPAQTVDGMDVDAVSTAIGAAAGGIRAGGGPAFVECLSFRFGKHSTSARETRKAAELATLREACPIAHYRALLTGAGLVDEAAGAAMQAEVDADIVAALAKADASAVPTAESVLADVA